MYGVSAELEEDASGGATTTTTNISESAPANTSNGPTE